MPAPARPRRRPLARLGRGAVAALFGSAVALSAVPARAVPTCSFDAQTGAMTVVVGTGETAVIARSGDAIALDGVPCDTATVTTTDSIAVDGSAGGVNVTIDLSGGPFEPGMTPEPDGTSEIEFTLAVPGASTVLIAGGPGADQIVLGVDGVNLNAAESPGDADVVIAGTPAVTIQGNGGNDVISVAGGAGTGAASAAALQGGADDDRLVGAIGGSAFDGGDGVDTVDYTAAPVPVVVILSSSAAVGSATDSLSGLENATASAFGDILMGDGGANALLGQAGDDRIDGGGGNDVLDGGEGTDTLEFGSSSSGVDVQLAKGTSSGAGEDTIAGFENVVGTGSADTIHGDSERNHITGGAGGDDLLGHAGRDIVKSGAGKDLASGQKGGDLIFGGKGKDQLDGGKGDDACRGGPDPDSFVFCEQIRLD